MKANQRDDLLDRVLVDIMREKVKRQIAFLRLRGYPDDVIFEAYRIESREADSRTIQ